MTPTHPESELVALLPKCITDLELCSQYEFVGSRITCDPPVLDTDLDVLCMLVDNRFAEVMHELQASGWTFDGSEYYANALDNNVGFRSYRNGELNLVLTTDPQFYKLFSAASSVAKRLNLLDKADRIALFQAVIYGNPAEPAEPATRAATVPQGVFSAEDVAELVGVVRSMRRMEYGLDYFIHQSGVALCQCRDCVDKRADALLTRMTPPPAEPGKGS